MTSRVSLKAACFFLFSFFLSSFSLAATPFTKEQFFQMATVAARDGSYENAVALYKKVLDLDPNFAPAYNSLGLVYQSWNGGDLQEATRYFRLATDVDPDYGEAWNNLGRVYYTQGSFASAKTAFLNALKARPDQADVHLALAWVYLLGESDADEAIKHFLAAVATVDNDMAHYGLGLAYILTGDKFKVLDEVTALRRAHKEAEALRLERMVREDARISSQKGTPLVTGKDLGGSVFDKELAVINEERSSQNKKGIPVRLTGPLQ